MVPLLLFFFRYCEHSHLSLHRAFVKSFPSPRVVEHSVSDIFFLWHRHPIEGTGGLYCLLRKTLAKRGKMNCQSSGAKLKQLDSNPGRPGRQPTHTGLTTRLSPSYDRLFLRNRGQIVERTYDWLQRSWVIARAKSVVTRSMVMFKTSNLRFQIVSGRR